MQPSKRRMVERFAPRFERLADDHKLVIEEQPPAATSKVYDFTVKLGFGDCRLRGRAHVRLLLCLAVAVLLLAISSDLLQLARRIRDFMHDRAVVRRESRDLRGFSAELGHFLDLSRADTLHSIVQQLKQNHPDSLAGIMLMPEVGILCAHWQFLSGRIARDHLSTPAFHELVEEFSALLRGYANYCVMPIFQRFAAEMRSEAKEHERSQLNGFQQRFAKLVTDYMRQLERLNAELRTMSPLTTVAIYCPPPL